MAANFEIDSKSDRTLPFNTALALLITGAALGVFGSLILFASALLATDLPKSPPIAQILWYDRYDSRLIAWILEWGHQQIKAGEIFTTAFWNAPAFYPHQYSLAFSDSLIGLQPIYTPLRLLGIERLTAIYLSLVTVTAVASALSLLLFGAMLRSIAPKIAGVKLFLTAAILSYISQLSPTVFNYLGHYQLFGFQLGITAIIAGIILLSGVFGLINLSLPKEVLLLITAASALWGITIGTYLAPMLLAIVVACSPALLVLTVSRFKVLTRNLLALRFWLAITLALTGLVYLVALHPYTHQTEEGLRKSAELRTEEYRQHSAKWRSALTEISSASTVYRPIADTARTESNYSPGAVTLLLVFIAALSLRSLRKAGYRFEALLSLLILALTLLGIVIALSTGPRAGNHWSIFSILSAIIPGLENVRAPGRFGMLTAPLFAILTIPFLLRAQRSAVMLYITALLLFIDFTPDIPVYRSELLAARSDRGGSAYGWVGAAVRHRCHEISCGMIELPVSGRDDIIILDRVLSQLDGTLVHRIPLVVGYGATVTKEMRAVLTTDRAVQQGSRKPRELLLLGRDTGAQFMLIHLSRYKIAVRKKLKKFINKKVRQRVISKNGESYLLDLR